MAAAETQKKEYIPTEIEILISQANTEEQKKNLYKHTTIQLMVEYLKKNATQEQKQEFKVIALKKVKPKKRIIKLDKNGEPVCKYDTRGNKKYVYEYVESESNTTSHRVDTLSAKKWFYNTYFPEIITRVEQHKTPKNAALIESL